MCAFLKKNEFLHYFYSVVFTKKACQKQQTKCFFCNVTLRAEEEEDEEEEKEEKWGEGGGGGGGWWWWWWWRRRRRRRRRKERRVRMVTHTNTHTHAGVLFGAIYYGVCYAFLFPHFTAISR
jgi:hypothetical protein